MRAQKLRALVTGAGGFLGSHVVQKLLDRGHSVRAVLRPASGEPPAAWAGRAEIVRADLRAPRLAETWFEGVDVLVHLAATMRGSAEALFMGTAVGTEKLLEAMRRAGSTRRIVLASSFSVYDWAAPRQTLDEETPLESKPHERDSYVVAKLWQERVTQRMAVQNDWTLTVLRPGFIYGPHGPEASGAGMKLGRVFVVIQPFAALPLTHVENCASAFADAAEKAVPGVFNIVDDERITAWRYAGVLAKRASHIWRIPVPYGLGLAVAHLAQYTSRLLFPPKGGKLPSILVPRRYQARFRPLRFPNRQAKQLLGWSSKPLFTSER